MMAGFATWPEKDRATLRGAFLALWRHPMRTLVAGFGHGGRAIPGNDEAMVQAIGERMAKPDGGLLLGRCSYEDMLASWNARGGPYRDALNTAPKYVASRSSATRLDWPNSTLLAATSPLRWPSSSRARAATSTSPSSIPTGAETEHI
jgi:hypothetical protein